MSKRKRAPLPCTFPGCGNPKIPGRGSRLCQEHHDTVRQRNLQYQSRWREENAGKLKEDKRNWWLDNRDRVTAADRQRYASDPAYRQEVNQRNNAYAEKNRGRIRAQKAPKAAEYRAYQRMRMHGLDEVSWQALWDAQEGRCYLCGNNLDPSPAKTHVEHYHGCVAHEPRKSCRYCQRGLACSRCNTLIALAGDDPDFLRKIAGKLEVANASILERQASAPGLLQFELQ